MEHNKELINILKAELTLLSKEILQNIQQSDINKLYEISRDLFEKMAAIKVLQDQLTWTEISEALGIEDKEDSVLESHETKPKEKNVLTDENPYKSVNKMTFVPKNKLELNGHNKNVLGANQKSAKTINIGLNDRIAFIKHLFKGDVSAYQKFIEQLNSFKSYESALAFINQQIKPQYDHWEGLDEYEFRLLQLLELKFA